MSSTQPLLTAQVGVWVLASHWTSTDISLAGRQECLITALHVASVDTKVGWENGLITIISGQW